MKFHVPSMTCGHCTSAISKSIATLDPEATVKTDLTTHIVTVSTSKSQTDVTLAIENAGYDAALR